MQYFRPGGIYFAGDTMPFFHDNRFHLFYLLDEQHHKALNGLGGHQWAHATSTNLVDWEHHPLALAITAADEGSICTGSVYYHAGTYYAYYATRKRDRTQHLGLATSRDGIHFQKRDPNPLASPGQGYSPYHYRDPHLFQDEKGGFHLLVTALREDTALLGQGGCLAHLVSTDLVQWTVEAPFMLPGYNSIPECPDHFFWNGWYYLLFSNSFVTRYRMARQPLGPWQRPPVDTLDGRLACVMKTAAFTNNRRIGVAWIGPRAGEKDDGQMLWGGYLVFRELIQFADGTLGTKFPAEMIPPTAAPLATTLRTLSVGCTGDADCICLDAAAGLAIGGLGGLPANVRITLQVIPTPGAASFGLRLRATEGQFESGYALTILPHERVVHLHNESLFAVEGLDQPWTLDIVLCDGIIDVCIDNRRCLINYCPEQRGDQLFFFAQDAQVTFAAIQVRPLLAALA